MRPIALRRLKALILTAVLLVGGSGASALDLALYHLGGAGAETASHRISGTDAPRSHADSCVLLDWTARAPYTASLGSPPLEPVGRRCGPVPGDSGARAPCHRPPSHFPSSRSSSASGLIRPTTTVGLVSRPP